METTTKIRFTTEDFHRMGKDRGEKWRMYAETGIPEYWIIRIDPDAPRALEAFQQPEGAAYHEEATYRYDEDVYDEDVEITTWLELGIFCVDDLLG